MKIYIFPNLSKINCQEYTASACKILNKNGAMLFMSDCYNEAFGNIPYISFGNEDDCIKKCDIIVAVGGWNKLWQTWIYGIAGTFSA